MTEPKEYTHRDIPVKKKVYLFTLKFFNEDLETGEPPQKSGIPSRRLRGKGVYLQVFSTAFL